MARLGGELWKDGYPEEVYEELLQRIMMGRGLKNVCRDEDMPHFTGVYMKCRHDPEFDQALKDAREFQCAGLTDDHLELLPQMLDGDIDPKVVTAHMHSTKMLIEKLAPKSFGEKRHLDHTSSDGSMTPKAPREMSESELLAIINAGK